MTKHLNKKNIALSLAAALWAGCDSNNATSAEKCIDENGCKELSGEIGEGGMIALYGVAPIFDPESCEIKGNCQEPEITCEEQTITATDNRVTKEVCADGSITTKDSLNYETGAHFVNGVQVNPEEDCKPVYNYAAPKVQLNDVISEDENAEEEIEPTEPELSCEEQLDQVYNTISNLKDGEIEVSSEFLDSLYSQRDSLEDICFHEQPLYGIFNPIVSPAYPTPEKTPALYVCADSPQPISRQKYMELLEEFKKNKQ